MNSESFCLSQLASNGIVPQGGKGTEDEELDVELLLELDVELEVVEEVELLDSEVWAEVVMLSVEDVVKPAVVSAWLVVSWAVEVRAVAVV